MGLDVSTGGRRPTLLELNPQYGFCIGIDISDHNKGLSILVCDIKGRIINKYLSASKSSEEFKIDNIINRVSRMINAYSVSSENILGIGVSVYGSGEKNFSELTQGLEREFNTSVLLENASCSSLFAEKTLNPN